MSRIADSHDLRTTLIAEGLNSIVQYDWQTIASRYYTQLYQPLLEELAGEHATPARVTR